MKLNHVIPKKFWEPFSLKSKEYRGVAMGALQIWLHRDGDDWECLVHRDPGSTGEGLRMNLEGQGPEEGQWRRLGSVTETPKLRFRPMMPNRPVVVRPEMPYTILPGERIQFFLGVPVWVALETPSEIRLLEEPVSKLSNTWFGTPMEGELAYAMRTLARREADGLDFEAWRVVCPVRLKNMTKDKLTFERICIRAQYLDIYQDSKEGLWANESGVSVRGGNNWSRISYARGAPKELKSPELLVKSSEEVKGGFSLRALTGAGGMFQ